MTPVFGSIESPGGKPVAANDPGVKGGLVPFTVIVEMEDPTVPTTFGVGLDAITGLVETTGTPAEAIAISRLWLTAPAEVVAPSTTLKFPAVVGVPEICPIPALNDKPGGRVPVRL
jgi:hypothetical protein